MHPALSIIAFTTASGFGYGLAALLGLGLLDPATWSAKIAHLVALALIAGGLLSSTLHLRNPQRAWRAFSQWRTSWLSREGVLAVLTFLPMTAMTAAALFFDTYLLTAGIPTAILAAATVYATSMIYASLKAIDAWHTPLTTAGYLAFALSGGLMLLAFFAATSGGAFGWIAAAALVSLLIAWGVNVARRQYVLALTPTSTPESATGLGGIGRVRLFEPPHMNGNYLTEEMGYRVARRHAAKLARIAVVLGGAAPALLLVLAMLVGSPIGKAALAGLAVLMHAGGVFIERWLFFAEARHAVMTYY